MGEDRRTHPNDNNPTANQRRLTVHDAARVLGISEDAVRMRIKRGTLAADKKSGRLYVVLDIEPTTEPTHDQTAAHIASLQDQVRYLREQLDAEREARTEERRRHDTLMAQLTSRIPAIEAPQEPPETPSEATEEPERVERRIPADAPPDEREYAVTPPPQPERVEPRSSTGDSQAATEGLSEAEPSLLWERVVVVILSTLPVTLTLPLALSTDISPSWAGNVAAGIGVLAWVVFPAVFGVRLGRKVRSLRFWRNVAPVAALLGLSIFIAAELILGIGGIGIIFAPIPSLVYSFAAVLGNALRRRQREKHIEERPSEFPQEAVSGAQQGWTPRQQAIVGLAGTIISALIGLIGTILTVLANT